MKRALVTGATGLLGSYVVGRLCAAGWSVRALVRDPARNGWLEPLGARPVVGSLADAASLHAAAAGCDAVFHAAATIGAGGDWETFRAGNVLGTAHVVAAAEAAGSRLVHVSSTAVFGRHRYHAQATDESVALPVLPARDAYGRSKQEAERVVLEAHGAGRLWACVVRPPIMYGKRDRQFAPRLGPVLARGVFPLISGGATTLSLVHADSVADGALRAATTSAAGGRVYHLTNDFDPTVRELVHYASLGLGCRVRTPDVPLGAARVALKALAGLLVLAGRRDLAPHTAGLLDMLTRNNPFSSERARRELGWSPAIRPAQGLPEAFRWWKQAHAGPGPLR
jgi:nucleoside-diphosphate-sugar epimerase